MHNEIISASDARTRLYTLIDRVGKLGERYTLTKNGKAVAVLVNPEELESWIETSSVLHDRTIMQQIKESEKDVQNGSVYSLDEVKKELSS